MVRKNEHVCKKSLQKPHSLRWTKGQIISKGLFGVLEFSQKTKEWIRRSSKNEFVCSFFGRIWGYQKSFQNYLNFNVSGIINNGGGGEGDFPLLRRLRELWFWKGMDGCKKVNKRPRGSLCSKDNSQISSASVTESALGSEGLWSF